MFDVLVFLLIAYLILIFGAGTLYLVSLVAERFILVTLPILVELYARIRYPNEYRD